MTKPSGICLTAIEFCANFAPDTALAARSTVLTAPFTIFAEVTELSASSLLVIESAAILVTFTALSAIFPVAIVFAAI